MGALFGGTFESTVFGSIVVSIGSTKRRGKFDLLGNRDEDIRKGQTGRTSEDVGRSFLLKVPLVDTLWSTWASANEVKVVGFGTYDASKLHR
jgi:hypothetical protein